MSISILPNQGSTPRPLATEKPQPPVKEVRLPEATIKADPEASKAGDLLSRLKLNVLEHKEQSAKLEERCQQSRCHQCRECNQQ